MILEIAASSPKKCAWLAQIRYRAHNGPLIYGSYVTTYIWCCRLWANWVHWSTVWLLFQSNDVVSEYVVYPNLQHNLRLLGGYNMSCYATRKIILLQTAKAKQHSKLFWRCRLDMSSFAMRKIIFYNISPSHARGGDVTWVKRLLICAKKNVKTKICTSHVDFVI